VIDPRKWKAAGTPGTRLDDYAWAVRGSAGTVKGTEGLETPGADLGDPYELSNELGRGFLREVLDA
jgi:hypothetical protein